MQQLFSTSGSHDQVSGRRMERNSPPPTCLVLLPQVSWEYPEDKTCQCGWLERGRRRAKPVRAPLEVISATAELQSRKPLARKLSPRKAMPLGFSILLGRRFTESFSSMGSKRRGEKRIRRSNVEKEFGCPLKGRS